MVVRRCVVKVEEVEVQCEIVMKCVFVPFLDSELDTFVSPQSLEGVETVHRHRLVWTDIWICCDDFCVPLL